MIKYLLTLASSILLCTSLYATHIRAVEISYRQLSGQGRTYEFTVTAIRDTGSSIPFGQGVFDFGDGETQEGFEISTNIIGEELELNVFKVTHTYPFNGVFIASYREENRNEGILNMTNSVQTPFYAETGVYTDFVMGNNNSPVFTVLPIDKGATGIKFQHIPGAYDPDGDSLSYQLTTPKQDLGIEVINYVFPNNPSFYDNYALGNEAQNGTPTFQIDPVTGMLTWDAPGEAGEYAVAIEVTEWRKVNGRWYEMGYMVRDMQIIIEQTENNRPTMEIESRDCVTPEDSLVASITAHDIDNDDLNLAVFGEVDGISIEKEYLIQEEFNFNVWWNPNEDQIRERPYLLYYKLWDDPKFDGPSLSHFETGKVTVKTHALQTELTRNDHLVTLTWTGNNPGDRVLIYRKLGSYEFHYCLNEIEELSGYQLIGEVTGQSTFTDDISAVSSGAEVCYRVVRVNDLGHRSVASSEHCVIQNTSNPILTKVSHEGDHMEISWINPYQAVGSYQVLRKDPGASSFQVIGNTGEFTFEDNNIDVTKVYTYKVLAKDDAGNTIGESAVSQNVITTTENDLRGNVVVKWGGSTAWSLHDVNQPDHVVYKADANGTFQPVGTVNVLDQGLYFIDRDDLVDGQTYCYKVLTKGTIGNTLFDQELYSFSSPSCIEVVITSSDHIQEEQLLTYPNPFVNELKFTKKLSAARLTIYSETGKIVKEVENFSGDRLDLRKLETGMYILIIQNGDDHHAHRIIKQ